MDLLKARHIAPRLGHHSMIVNHSTRESSLKAIPPTIIADAKLAIDIAAADFHPKSLAKTAMVDRQGINSIPIKASAR
jgi:hypothetical protein